MKKYLVLIGLCLATLSTPSVAKQVTLKVNEMNCQLCAYLVNKALRDIDGVTHTKASMKENSVLVQMDNNVDNQTLIDAIEKLHYTATVLE